jgi:hypothetical protein
MAIAKSKGQKRKTVHIERQAGKVYTSLEQWEQENFPSAVCREDSACKDKDPVALGSSIADRIFRKVEATFLKNS